MPRRLLIEPPDSLVETWLESLEARGASIKDGLDSIEAETGLVVSHSRLGEYRRGTRGMTGRTISVMAVQAAPYLFRKVGVYIGEADAQAIARALSPKVID